MVMVVVGDGDGVGAGRVGLGNVDGGGGWWSGGVVVVGWEFDVFHEGSGKRGRDGGVGVCVW